jgi:hypothetical protein
MEWVEAWDDGWMNGTTCRVTVRREVEAIPVPEDNIQSSLCAVLPVGPSGSVTKLYVV